MKQDLSVIRGTTNTFNISVSNSEGEPYILHTGEKLLFGVKLNPDDENYAILKTLTSENEIDGVYKFVIQPEDTIALPCYGYYYDVGLQTDEGYFNIIECSEFNLVQNITKEVES